MSRLLREAERRGVRPPTTATLRRYGLTVDEWLCLLKDQGWMCPICLRTKVVWNTDHEHIPMWKTRSDEERKARVRGILCAHCNHRVVHSTISAETAQRIADYMKRYEQRRDACLSGLTSKRQD